MHIPSNDWEKIIYDEVDCKAPKYGQWLVFLTGPVVELWGEEVIKVFKEKNKCLKLRNNLMRKKGAVQTGAALIKTCILSTKMNSKTYLNSNPRVHRKKI